MTDDIPESRFLKPAQPLSMIAVSDAAAYKPMLERAKAAERRVAELEDDCERERMRLVAVSTAALDPKRLAGILPEYHSATMMDVLSLRARLTEVTAERDEALRLVSHASGDIAELQATVARLRAVADQAHALIDAWDDWGGPVDGVLVDPTFRTVMTSFEELERRMDALAEPACICPKAAIPVLAAGCPEHAPVEPTPSAAPTYAEVLASCTRAAARVATWPAWKQALSRPEPAPPAVEPQRTCGRLVCETFAYCPHAAERPQAGAPLCDHGRPLLHCEECDHRGPSGPQAGAEGPQRRPYWCGNPDCPCDMDGCEHVQRPEQPQASASCKHDDTDTWMLHGGTESARVCSDCDMMVERWVGPPEPPTGAGERESAPGIDRHEHTREQLLGDIEFLADLVRQVSEYAVGMPDDVAELVRELDTECESCTAERESEPQAGLAEPRKPWAHLFSPVCHCEDCTATRRGLHAKCPGFVYRWDSDLCTHCGEAHAPTDAATVEQRVRDAMANAVYRTTAGRPEEWDIPALIRGIRDGSIGRTP